MISSEFATAQLQRMAGLNFFPVPKKGDALSTAAFRELRLALECAASDSIGKLVVDDWIRNNADAPKPAELRAAAYAENERLERQEADKYRPPAPRQSRCPHCQDFGIAETTDAADIRSIASWCECERGREGSRRQHSADQRCYPPQSPCPDCVNQARRKLIAAGNRGRLTPDRSSPMRNVGEVYQGEF